MNFEVTLQNTQNILQGDQQLQKMGKTCEAGRTGTAAVFRNVTDRRGAMDSVN